MLHVWQKTHTEIDITFVDLSTDIYVTNFLSTASFNLRSSIVKSSWLSNTAGLFAFHFSNAEMIYIGFVWSDITNFNTLMKCSVA